MLRFIKHLFTKKEEKEDPMKYLIVGLGNMGAKYDDTRHNIGFEVVDHLASEKEAKWKHETLGDITEVKHKGRTLILLKPSTYMNLSGKAVNYWVQKKKIQPNNLLVVVDDLNIDFGQLRLKGKGSHGGHNGLADIEKTLGHRNYVRLRIGIGNNFRKGRQVDYVLGKWSKEEQKDLPDILERSTKAIQSFASIGLGHTMNSFNK